MGSYQDKMNMPTWGLYRSNGDLLATCRSATELGAYAAFKAMDPWALRWVVPTSKNVRRLP